METRQWRVSRGGYFSARCRRRSKSPYFAPVPRISRLPMRFRVRSTSRRSRWFASATLPRRAVGACLSVKGGDVAGRERRCSKQSKSSRERQWTKRGADHLREDQAWSERHGSEQQMSATRFAAPASCLRNRHSRSAISVCACDDNEPRAILTKLAKLAQSGGLKR